MRRFICGCLLLLSLLFCAGCQTKFEKYAGNLSEVRDVVMTAESESMQIELISGERETPYVIDGISGEKAPFTVVTVTPAADDRAAEYRYTLYMGGKTFEGAFNRHPFMPTYSFELNERTEGAVTLTVTEQRGFVENYELESRMTEGMIGAGTALDLALIRLKNNVSSMTGEGGVLNAEIYIRLIENPITGEGGYYWYVAFVPAKYEVFAVLIHPESKEIVAVRE